MIATRMYATYVNGYSHWVCCRSCKLPPAGDDLWSPTRRCWDILSCTGWSCWLLRRWPPSVLNHLSPSAWSNRSRNTCKKSINWYYHESKKFLELLDVHIWKFKFIYQFESAKYDKLTSDNHGWISWNKLQMKLTFTVEYYRLNWQL